MALFFLIFIMRKLGNLGSWTRDEIWMQSNFISIQLQIKKRHIRRATSCLWIVLQLIHHRPVSTASRESPHGREALQFSLSSWSPSLSQAPYKNTWKFTQKRNPTVVLSAAGPLPNLSTWITMRGECTPVSNLSVAPSVQRSFFFLWWIEKVCHVSL